MTIETVKDNQWWFGSSAHRAAVEPHPEIVLRIAGRECILRRSAVGRDGRPTMSFTFADKADAAFWVSLRGEDVEIELVATSAADARVDRGYGVEEAEDVQDHEPETAPSGNGHASPRDPRGASIGRTNPTLFDDYIAIDWSAAAARCTGRDSVWVGMASFRPDGQLDVGEALNPPTRDAAIAIVQVALEKVVREKRRALVSFDFPYALPSSGYSSLGVDSWDAYWRDLARTVEDRTDNGNNRFAVAAGLNARSGMGQGPFWGAPVGWTGTGLTRTKPRLARAPSEFRLVEEVLRSQKRRPFSVWQLYGNGSVGSQALVGIPHVERLRRAPDLAPASRVWPFENGWDADTDGPLIVHAEIWPGAVDVDLSRHPVRDAAQVLSVVEWMAREDAHGQLAGWLGAFRGNEAREQRVEQEGWILGVRPDAAGPA